MGPRYERPEWQEFRRRESITYSATESNGVECHKLNLPGGKVIYTTTHLETHLQAAEWLGYKIRGNLPKRYSKYGKV